MCGIVTGLVRAPLLTTIMQVASRFLLVWGIVYVFPATALSPMYSTMLLAWSVTEVIRYSYFAINLAYGTVPAALVWARYNAFFVLYPLGISSECWLVWLASGPAKWKYDGLDWALYLVLAIYVPGAHDPSSRKREESGRLTSNRLVCSVHAYDGATTEGVSLGEEEPGSESCIAILASRTRSIIAVRIVSQDLWPGVPKQAERTEDRNGNLPSCSRAPPYEFRSRAVMQ